VISFKSADYTAPAIAARVVEWQNNGDLPSYIVVENLDSSASASIVYQESDDGANWSDIATTTATINPGYSDGQIVTSTRRKLALFAGGNVQLKVSVVRQVNGAAPDLGLA